ncbi:MAG: hypothetical protein EA353_13620 [Puniceicoccaceae bacterium]|nr:MAG: hypothetical protein EA353_13620 [Puniceicoccaceae bacterium]
MALYKYTNSELKAVKKNTMASLGIKERDDLQRVLRDNIDAVSPDTLIIAEEFSNWQDSNRRIDLLGVDTDGTLAVIELKRTEDGGHMDLQAIRYAAMISTLTFEQIVDAFSKYLKSLGQEADARILLTEHLDCEPEDMGSRTRIVLVSADYSSEITTAVLWLNEQGLNINCVRLVAYRDDESIYFDVQQIIPLPEASEYMVKVREKEVEIKAKRNRGMKAQFIVTYRGTKTQPLAKRHTMFFIVSKLIENKITPGDIQQLLGSNRFVYCEGTFSEIGEVESQIVYSLKQETPINFESHRFFNNSDELFHADGKTFLFSNQWGENTQNLAEKLIAGFPQVGLSIKNIILNEDPESE